MLIPMPTPFQIQIHMHNDKAAISVYGLGAIYVNTEERVLCPVLPVGTERLVDYIWDKPEEALELLDQVEQLAEQHFPRGPGDSDWFWDIHDCEEELHLYN